MIWQTTRFALDLARPHIMGIVNLTPDSFSDGGQHQNAHEALNFAQQLLKEGADILDLGAESTRPGATPISAEQELTRLLPVLREVVRWNIPISVDTYKPSVMQAALDVGADIVNDVWALRQPGALQVLARHSSCGVCLMHMNGEPSTMQLNPMHTHQAGEAVSIVKEFLRQRSQELKQQNIASNRIAWDVGIGFGKTVAQNFELLAQQASFLSEGYPLFCAWSRKSSLARALGKTDDDAAHSSRIFASVAACVIAVERGARVVRVHDVRATKEALAVWGCSQAM